MIGREIGNYKIIRRLGEGGVGEVFAGNDLMLNRAVAIKALRPEFSRDTTATARFRAEAESLARLGHRNITTVYALLRDGDALFLVMELVGGRTLEALLLGCGRLTEAESLAVGAQVLDGLAYAHAAGVLHRDIKPSNLMVSPSGLVKIMDFGIARVRGSGRMTREGAIVGTLAYMSPEQIQGEEGDERSDIYSLAIVLYELLSGSPPFVCRSEYELIRAQVEAPPPRLVHRVDGIRPKVEGALMTALAKQPAERFPTAAAFAEALGVAGDEAAAVARVAARLGGIVVAATRLDIAQPAEGTVAPPRQRQVAATRLAAAADPAIVSSPGLADSAARAPAAGLTAMLPPAAALSPRRRQTSRSPAPPAGRGRGRRIVPIGVAVALLSAGIGLALLDWGDDAATAVPAALPTVAEPSHATTSPEPPGAGAAVTPGLAPGVEPPPAALSDEVVPPPAERVPQASAGQPPHASIVLPPAESRAAPDAASPPVEEPISAARGGEQPAGHDPPSTAPETAPADRKPAPAHKRPERKQAPWSAPEPDQGWKIIRE